MTDFLLSCFLFVPLLIILSSWLEKPKRDLLDVRILLAFLFFLGAIVRPLYLINTEGYLPARYSLDDIHWFLAILACTIGFVFLTIGFKASSSLSIRNVKWVLESVKYDRRMIWLCIGVFALVGVYGAYIKLIHSQHLILSDVTFQAESKTRPSGYFSLLRSLLYVAIGLVYWDILQFPRKRKYIRVSGLLILVLIAITQPFLVGARGQLLNILFMLIVPFHYLIRKVTAPRALILGVFITIMVVFLGATRGSSVDISSVNLSKSDYSDFVLRSHRFFDLVSIGKIIEHVPENADYLYGSSFARFFVVPVPREIWSNKPISLGQVVGAQIYEVGVGVIGGGVPPTIVGELYFNFGGPAIIAGMFLFGVLMRAVYSLVNGKTKTPASVIIYAFSLMAIVGIFMGDFSLGLIGAMLKIVPFYIVLQISRLKPKNVRRFSSGS